MVGDEILHQKKGHVNLVTNSKYDDVYDNDGRYTHPDLNLPDKLDKYLSEHAMREDTTTGSLMVYILKRATVEDKKYNFDSLPISRGVYRSIAVPDDLYDKIKMMAESQNTSWNQLANAIFQEYVYELESNSKG
ncbi:MAG TPA: hypothetical protein VJH34_00200 [archaeon]|nr:hypothetical protein [archaeon]